MSASGVARVIRLEVSKLSSQLVVTVVLWVCVLAPVLLVLALKVQSGTPADTLFGRWVHASGLAIPLVVMGFAGQWALPAIASIVAGDVFSSEDRYSTWKLVLGRSRNRAEVFTAKTVVALGFAVLAACLVILSSLAAGLLLVGRQPLLNLSGTLVPAGKGAWLVLLSGLVQLAPVVTMAAIALLLSVLTRNSLVGVAGPVLLGLVIQLVTLVDLPPVLRSLLPSGTFAAWHGLWLDNQILGPIGLGCIACAVLTVACVTASAVVFLRRDLEVR
jgi:ABC-2 type transport system permease protein